LSDFGVFFRRGYPPERAQVALICF